ncbi:MAG TPA: TetR/AcrR family transcriptional regulator [Burkholderiaceae bacterium]|nr:TetR/AcrR family transcriptional regulator [Burkholderiaceae bacterium]
MRTKTETRRDAILSQALQVFREVGFDAASMSQIAGRVGGSKATLYNYFSSKEELLLDAMLHSADQHAQNVMELLEGTEGLPSQLHGFVQSLLTLINSPETTEVLRVAISVGGTTDVGRKFYELGTHDVWSHIAQVLRAEIERGTLRKADPDLMAMHLRCLCEADLIRNLLGAGVPADEAETRHKAQCIVDIFMKTYGAEP